jgi:hypothetical protein
VDQGFFDGVVAVVVDRTTVAVVVGFATVAVVVGFAAGAVDVLVTGAGTGLMCSDGLAGL